MPDSETRPETGADVSAPSGPGPVSTTPGPPRETAEPTPSPTATEDPAENSAEARQAPGGMQGPQGPLFRLIKDQRVLFLMVGGVNTLVGTLWFVLFDSLLGHRWNGWGHYPALVLTYVFSILCAFVLYRKLVFRVHGHVWRDLVRFASVYVLAFFINLALLAVLVNGLHWPAIVSQFIIVFVTTALSWFGHSSFSFRRSGDGDS